MSVKQPIRIYVSQKWLANSEIENKCSSIVQSAGPKELVVKSAFNERKYMFDQVFTSSNDEQDIHNQVSVPLILSAIAGYNCTEMVYGPSGSGKFRTMFGELNNMSEDIKSYPNMGLVPRAAYTLFRDLSKLPVETEYTVQISFFDVYNEEAHDLLANYLYLRVQDDPINKGLTCIKDLSKVTVLNMRDVICWTKIGLEEQKSVYSKLNIDPKKSNLVFIYTINVRDASSKEGFRAGKLLFVEFAGCENIKANYSRDLVSINRSITNVTKVIKSLTQQQQYVPFRESKLTRILQDSFAGSTKTAMIFTFFANNSMWNDTINLLDLAQMAKSIYTYPTVNVHKQQSNVVHEMNNAISKLNEELIAIRAGKGFYISAEAYDRMNEENEDMTKKIMDCISRMRELENLAVSQKQQLAALEESFKTTNNYLAERKSKLEQEKANNKQMETCMKKRIQSYSQANENTVKLMNVCEQLTENVEVIHKKLQDKRQVNVNNANVAKKIADQLLECFNDLKVRLNERDQHQITSYQEFAEVNKSLQEQFIIVLRRILQAARDLQTLIVDDNLIYENIVNQSAKNTLADEVKDIYNVTKETIEMPTIKKEQEDLEKMLDVSQRDLYVATIEKFTKFLDALELKTNNENNIFYDILEGTRKVNIEKDSKIRSALQRDESLIEQLKNSLMRLDEEKENVVVEVQESSRIADEFLKCNLKRAKTLEEKKLTLAQIIDVLVENDHITKSQRKKIENVAKYFEEVQIKVIENKKECDEKMSDLTERICGTYINDVREETENLLAVFESRKKEFDAIQESVVKDIKQKREEVENKVNEIAVITNKQNEEVQSITAKTLVNLETIASSISFVGHVGDTPVKINYNIPKDVNEVIKIDLNDSDKEN